MRSEVRPHDASTATASSFRSDRERRLRLVIFWDVGGAIAIVRYVFRDPNMDLRFVALGAILPNLVDKPIGSLLFWDHFRNGRIYAHALVFSVGLLVVVMLLTRRGTVIRKALVGLAVGQEIVPGCVGESVVEQEASTQIRADGFCGRRVRVRGRQGADASL